MHNYFWNTTIFICFWSISRQWEPQRGSKKACTPEISREALHLKEVWVCRRCQLIVPLWHTNVNLSSFEVCPFLLKMHLMLQMSVNIKGHILPLFLILIYIYRKVKWKTMSWEMLICKEALQFQACGLNHAVESPKCWPPQHPIPAHTTHRASA